MLISKEINKLSPIEGTRHRYQPGNIIERDIIVPRKTYSYIKWDFPFSPLIPLVGCCVKSNVGGNLRLRFVSVLAQISYSSIQIVCSRFLYYFNAKTP